jgi:N-acetylglucosamine kinase-like BadF-type ATPase
MKYYLGIDIGNTKTQYALANMNGFVVSLHKGSGANHQDIGQEETYSRLKEGLGILLSKVNVRLNEIAFAYLGVAGADTQRDVQILDKLLKKLLEPTLFDFDNDGIIALKNGVEMGSGIVITCGTGNINVAVNNKGDVKRIGGLCDHLGDNLGASFMAKKVTYAATRCRDERDFPSILPGKICEYLGINEIYDLINIDFDSEIVKKINMAFFEAASEGDGKALELVWDFTKEIIRIMEYFLFRMFNRNEKFKLVLDGHVFKSGYEPFMKMIKLAVTERYPLAEIVIPEFPPVMGSLYFAFEKDKRLTKAIIKNLKKSFITGEAEMKNR